MTRTSIQTTIRIASMLLISLLTACSESDPTTAINKSSGETTHRVEVVTISVEPLNIIQKISGNLEAVTQRRIYNEEQGRITALPFHQGDKVNVGDILVKLDDALIKSEVEKARASYHQAKADLTRLKKLLPKNISTKEEVAQANTLLNLAKADIDYQRIRLQRTTITAAIAGVVSARLFEPGDFLGVQSHILTIIDPSRLRARVQLTERLLPLVRKNQKVSLHIDALGSTNFTANVTRIFPTINDNNHKGTIEVELNPAPPGALSGQFVHLTLNLKLDDQLVVPTRSIQLEPAGAYVYRIAEENTRKNKTTKVEKVSFDQGQQFSGKTVVLSKLQVGDRIVTRGFLGLRDGKEVDVAHSVQTTK